MPSFFTEDELHSWKTGNAHQTHKKLGAHLQSDGSVRFAVWAPHAYSVSVVGDFNGWDGRQHPMQKDKATGIWHTTVEEAGLWSLYMYELRTGPDAPPFLKSDPYAFYCELRPKRASIVYDPEGFAWSDSGWMDSRAEAHAYDRPLSIYEVHLGSWKRKGWEDGDYLGYRELADELVPYVSEMGFTHIELLPVTEYPFDPSWGYQVTGYYAPTSRFGEPKEFMHFVNECHKAGLGVILDWVPAHFPKDEEALRMFDGTALYEHEHPLRREQKDWGTHIFDYGKAGVRNFLISNAVYWCDYFHIDGLRLDAVASMLYLDYSKEEGEWIPNKEGGNEHLEAIGFLRDVNRTIHEYFPSVLTFAEESTAWPGVTRPAGEGGLGFDYKWNMGWMNDTLSYIQMDDNDRSRHPENITFPMVYARNERFVLPMSHDEVVHLKKPLVYKSPGTEAEKFANLRLLWAYMFGHPGKKLLFMGGEFAQTSEWSEEGALDWHLLEHEAHKGMRQLVVDLLDLYRNEKVLSARDDSLDGFEWVELGNKKEGFFAFIRKSQTEASHLLFLLNFSSGEIFDYSPEPFGSARYESLINTDSVYYGGRNRGSLSGHGSRQQAGIAPYSALVLKSIC